MNVAVGTALVAAKAPKGTSKEEMIRAALEKFRGDVRLKEVADDANLQNDERIVIWQYEKIEDYGSLLLW